MNAQEIIEYIRTSEKKTPVKVYVWEKEAVEFPNCHVFQAAEGQKIIFGDWKDIAPVQPVHKRHRLRPSILRQATWAFACSVGILVVGTAIDVLRLFSACRPLGQSQCGYVDIHRRNDPAEDVHVYLQFQL